MAESSKTIKRWGEEREDSYSGNTLYLEIYAGQGIDIGCGRLQTFDGADPVMPEDKCVHHDSDICNAETMEIFQDGQFDYVWASHILEHLENPVLAIQNWYRIVKPGGLICIFVPSGYRYEKKLSIPNSRWNLDHKRFYTLGSLLAEIEAALKPNTYYIERLMDCVDGYDWSIPPDQHPVGEYQIECVIRKINPPDWELGC